jgi:multidrug efflux pump subunit AcrA (membrane-fusion protein)
MPLFRWTKKNKIFAVLAAAVFVVAVVKGRGCAKSLEGDLSAPIQRGTIIESVYGIGTVTANKTFQFKAGVINTIHNLFVKEGDVAKQGDALLELDGGVVVKAPFDGTVTSLPFKVGENIFAQSVVLELVDLLDRYLVVSLEQRGALRVRRGQPAKLSFDGMREESFTGAVDSVYSSGNNFLVRIDISKLPPQILPGMTADTAIGIQERQNVLLVPVAAIDHGMAYVQRNGIKQKVNVQTGIIDGDMAEAVAGDLNEGDRLLIRKKVKK